MEISPEADPACVVMHRTFDDFDELAREVRGWGLDWRQLDRGPLTASIQQVAAPTILLSRFRFGRKFHQRGTAPTGMRTIAVLGQHAPPVEWRGCASTPDSLVAFPPDDEFDFVSDPEFYGDTVSVSVAKLREVAEAVGRPDPEELLPKGASFLAASPRRIATLRSLLATIHRRAGRSAWSPRRACAMEFEVAAALLGAVDTSNDALIPSAKLRDRALRRAVAYIEANADKPPTIEEICQASQASWRTLDYAFRYRFDVTPQQYMLAMRLQRVRRDLVRSSGGQRVSEIAADWGFWHMGKFAADYRRQFGELPSATLRRTTWATSDSSSSTVRPRFSR